MLAHYPGDPKTLSIGCLYLYFLFIWTHGCREKQNLCRLRISSCKWFLKHGLAVLTNSVLQGFKVLHLSKPGRTLTCTKLLVIIYENLTVPTLVRWSTPQTVSTWAEFSNCVWTKMDGYGVHFQPCLADVLSHLVTWLMKDPFKIPLCCYSLVLNYPTESL